MEDQNPIFSVFRTSIIKRSDVAVEVYGDPAEEYHIEGAFSQRSCTIYNTSVENSSKEHVAEIKRKVDPTTNVLLGKDVFLLCLNPGCDGAFAMGLVLLLDQMVTDDADGHKVDPNV
uniref:Uncharacterized protein n=2 Tax=Davidia involucrata TaxID=16924 RepID=A0A5B6Z1M8_DAVIN